MFRKTPIAWLCAALFASSASYAATPAAAPAEPMLSSDYGSETRADTRTATVPVMPVMGINDEDFPIEPIAAGDGDLWERIRKGFSIPEMSTPLVSNHTATYAARPEAFERLGKRASRYLFYVVRMAFVACDSSKRSAIRARKRLIGTRCAGRSPKSRPMWAGTSGSATRAAAGVGAALGLGCASA
jgi:hypothetical protein